MKEECVKEYIDYDPNLKEEEKEEEEEDTEEL